MGLKIENKSTTGCSRQLEGGKGGKIIYVEYYISKLETKISKHALTEPRYNHRDKICFDVLSHAVGLHWKRSLKPLLQMLHGS